MITTKTANDPVYSTLINDTAANTGVWNEINIVTNTAFTLLTDANRDGDTLTSGTTFVAPNILYGNFTAITLASGAVIAIKK